MKTVLFCLLMSANALADIEWVNDIQPNPLTFTGFGDDLAIMGEWLVVGDTKNDDMANDAGAVHIYNNSTGQWVLYQTLYASNPDISDELGSAVDIEIKHDTGELWVVGAALRDDDVNLDNGAVYAWTLDDMGVFVLDEKFTGINLVNQNFGSDIALNYDYIPEINAELWVLVIGDDAKRHMVNGQNTATGGVTIYKKLAGPHVWEEETIQTGQLYLDGLTGNDWIGRSVAIDGATIVLGAPGDDDHNLPGTDGGNMGAIHVLTRDQLTQTWACCSIAYPSYREKSANFGHDVDIIKQPNDNRIIMASAPFEKEQGNHSIGAVYAWFNGAEAQRLQPQIYPGGQGEFFGGSIAANGDPLIGDTEFWVGAPYSEDRKGRIYHYSLNPNYDGNNDLYLLQNQIVAYNREQNPWDTGQFGLKVATDGLHAATSSQSNYVGNHSSVYTAELPIFKNGFQSP